MARLRNLSIISGKSNLWILYLGVDYTSVYEIPYQSLNGNIYIEPHFRMFFVLVFVFSTSASDIFKRYPASLSLPDFALWRTSEDQISLVSWVLYKGDFQRYIFLDFMFYFCRKHYFNT